jgi:hypothetical protein
MKSLNAVFSKAASETKVSQTATPPATIVSQEKKPEQPPTPEPKPTELSPRIKEILAAFEPVKDLLQIDTESSTMFVMVKPAKYLGSDNFAKVAAIVRGLGGQYVSASKNSHFEIPKAPKTNKP